MKSIELSTSIDAEFVRKTANVVEWSVYMNETQTKKVLRFADDREATVQAVLSDYDRLYLPTAKAAALARASQERYCRILRFQFGGSAITLDEVAKANITGLVAGMERDATMASIVWSIGGGEFITLTHDMVFALGKAAFAHVQGLFACHQTVATQIKAVADLSALNALQIETNPAWDQAQASSASLLNLSAAISSGSSSTTATSSSAAKGSTTTLNTTSK